MPIDDPTEPSQRKEAPHIEVSEAVGHIDEMIDSILRRPGMHGVGDPQGLEAQMMTLLTLRHQLAPLPDVSVPWKSIYGKWGAEYFGDKSPNNAAIFSRLVEEFDWAPGTTYQDEANAAAWPKIIEFYEELVRRERAAAEIPDPVTMEVLTDLLGLVMAKRGDTIMSVDLSDVPTPDTLEKLTPEQREEVARWAADCHFEASDNDVRPGACPEPLRALLPDDHPYKTWRVR